MYNIWIDLFYALITINIFTILIVAAGIGMGANFSFVNPKVIYDNIKVNWFGAWFLAVIFHIILLPTSILYWIYKIFTVGRK